MAAGGKRAFPKDDGKSIAGSTRGAELGNQRKHTDCEFLRLITTMRENKQTNNGLKFSQLCFFVFFVFSSLNRSACVQGVPCKWPWGALSRRAAGGSFPVGFGTMGTTGGLGLGPLLLHGRGIVLVHGENYFLEWGGRGAGTELPTHLPPHPPTRLFTQYLHTHTRPQGTERVPLFRLESQGSVMETTKKPKKPQKPQPLQKD